jgi:hypothetical protein
MGSRRESPFTAPIGFTLVPEVGASREPTVGGGATLAARLERPGSDSPVEKVSGGGTVMSSSGKVSAAELLQRREELPPVRHTPARYRIVARSSVINYAGLRMRRVLAAGDVGAAIFPTVSLPAAF